MGIDKMKVEEKEVMHDTVERKNDLTRIIYRISTMEENPSEDALREMCEHLIENETVDYEAIAFFFWPEGDPVGEIAATASLTYAPGGVWEDAFDSSDPMELVCDFYRYG